ncbi:hypothetical protein Tco_1157895, partial [Tanacetum coccineum]
MHELVICVFMHLPDVSTNQQEFTQEGSSNPDDEVANVQQDMLGNGSLSISESLY